MCTAPISGTKDFVLSENGTKLHAYAKKREDNQKISLEFRALQAIQEGGVRTVLGDDSRDPIWRSDGCAGYTMERIDGYHSKTDKGEFNRTLLSYYQLRNKVAQRQALDDLVELDSFLKTNTIGDLQLMLEVTTGKLYVCDPTYVREGPAGASAWIAKWRKFLTGQDTNVGPVGVNKKD